MEKEKQFVIRWPELNAQVRARAIHHNQHLFDWFVANLPTRSVLNTSVVAGLQLNFQNLPITKVPCDWIQEDCPREFMDEYPAGTFMFFMTAGNVAGMNIKVGAQTEHMDYPTFARVIDEDMETLNEVAWKVWEDVLMGKKTYHADILAAED